MRSLTRWTSARSPLRCTHPLQTLFATPIETRLAIQTAVAPCTRADVHSPPTDRAAAKSTRVELPCPRGYPEPTQSLPSAYLELTQSLPSAIPCHMPCVSSPLCHEPPAVSAAEERAEPPDSGRPNGSLCGTRQRREREKKRDPRPETGEKGKAGWEGRRERGRCWPGEMLSTAPQRTRRHRPAAGARRGWAQRNNAARRHGWPVRQRHRWAPALAGASGLSL